MYFLLEMGIFYCHVSFWGVYPKTWIPWTWIPYSVLVGNRSIVVGMLRLCFAVFKKKTEYGVSKNRDTSKWMVYNGNPYLNGWFGGKNPIFGNTHIVASLKLTDSLHLKMDGWNTIVSFWGPPYFQVRTVSFRAGKWRVFKGLGWDSQVKAFQTTPKPHPTNIQNNENLMVCIWSLLSFFCWVASEGCLIVTLWVEGH